MKKIINKLLFLSGLLFFAIQVTAQNNGTERNSNTVRVAGQVAVEGDILLNCTVFPNPARQYFNMKLQTVSNEKIEVRIYNMAGRLVTKMEAKSNETLRLGDDLRPGFYIVELSQGREKLIVRIIKE